MVSDARRATPNSPCWRCLPAAAQAPLALAALLPLQAMYNLDTGEVDFFGLLA